MHTVMLCGVCVQLETMAGTGNVDQKDEVRVERKAIDTARQVITWKP